MTVVPDVIGLDQEGATDARVAGGKAATLAALSEQGFPVPPGFVVTTTACERLVDVAGDVTAEPPTVELPADLRDEIGAALRRLGGGPVAVRSSGTAEDLADASYAGQYETVLGVSGVDDVAGAIRRCLASARSARVRAYGGGDRAPMAVLIQAMVPAEVAGVAFTANPVTGDDEILVSAVRGIGDRLVSGEATPDEWVVRGEDVRCRRATEGVLDAQSVRDVATLARRVATSAGRPQDLEWAMADGELFLLQDRPITALPQRPRIDVPRDGFWMKDDTHYPMPLTPFGASVYLPAIDRAAGAMGRDFGLLFDGFEQRSLGGEVYARAIPVGGKDRRPPPPWVMWIAARVAPVLRERNRMAGEALDSGLADRLLDRWEHEWRDAFREEGESFKRVDLPAMSDDDLMVHLDRARDFLERGQLVHFRLSAAGMFPVHDLLVACEGLLGWDSVRSLELVSGSSAASGEPGRELRALASRCASDATAARVLDEGGRDMIARLEAVAPDVADAIRAYLDRYGHRPASYDPGDPTLFERPTLLAGLLLDRMTDSRPDRSDRRESSEAARARALASLASRSGEERDRFERALEAARRAYGNREDNIFWVDNQPCAFLRYAAVEIGRRLAERGLLARATDAVFLAEEELRRSLAHTTAGDLRPLVARRKAERAWVAAHPGPASYGTDPGPPPSLRPLPRALRRVNTAALRWMQLIFPTDRAGDSRTQLGGVPGSPGRHTGPARLVRSEAEFVKLRPGDVLVCPITSPAWSILFIQAGAVVTEGGGVLAHTAVIAREYGIPAVLATGTATQRLSDGDLITVDGTAGTVTVHDSERSAA